MISRPYDVSEPQELSTAEENPNPSCRIFLVFHATCKPHILAKSSPCSSHVLSAFVRVPGSRPRECGGGGGNLITARSRTHHCRRKG
jgi:hypothetical protein